MKSIYLIIIIIFGLSLSFMSLQNISSELNPRKEKWVKIEENIRHGIDPKTTLKLCKELLLDIQKGNFPDEEVKAKLYIYHLNYEISDDTDQLNQNLINEIDNDITTLSFPQKNYMALIGYKLIEEYATMHSWEIKQRKNSNYNPLNITTWRMEDFNKKSIAYRKLLLKDAEKLKQIPLSNATYLFLKKDDKKPYIKNAYQAILYLDLQLQKQKLYDAQISSIDIEDAFTELCSNTTLQHYINTSKLFRDEFETEIKTRLEMEFWTNLVSLQNNPKIEEIYLNNLIAINTQNNSIIQAERDYRIAQLYYSKANKVTWNGIKTINDITVLKKEKTTQFTKTIQYLDLIINLPQDSNSIRLQELQRLSQQLKRSITTDSSFNINGKSTYISNQDLVFNISSKNIESVNLEVYKLDPTEYHKTIKSIHWNERDNILSHLKNKTKSWEGQYNISYISDYIEDKRQIIIPSLNYGLYAVTMKDNPNKSLIFQVSDLYIERELKTITVKSAKDYSIIKQATLCVGIKDSKCIPFNKQGVVTYTNNKSEYYSIINGDDTYYLFDQNLNYYKERINNNKVFKDEIFTDRSIYRPGQTVHLKVLQKYKKNKDVLFLLSNGDNLKVELRDSQYELIEQKTISLNEFSSGYTSFNLPKELLNGNFTIITDHGRERIQVEEYKRPTFFIDFKKDSTEKRLGDIIRLPIHAKTFSGVNLNKAKIEYTISYNNMPNIFWRCGYFNWSESYILNHQNATLDKFGAYILEINSNDIPNAMKDHSVVQFSVDVKIIDTNRDSETETMSFILSKEGITFGTQPLLKTAEGTPVNQNIDVRNFQDVHIDKTISYSILKLKEPKHILQQSHYSSEHDWLLPNHYNKTKGLEHLSILNAGAIETWEVMEEVGSGTITSNQNTTLDVNTTAGAYKIIYTTIDEHGTKITKNQYLKVYPTKGKPVLKDENIFSSAQQKTYNVGDKFTTSITLPFNSHYYYVLSDFNGVLKSGVIKGKDIFKLTHIIEDRNKGGIVIDVKTVYNNKLYNFSKAYNVDWKLDLTAKWVNIRHKVQPQSEEEWKLEVKNASGDYEKTEVLAFMYDASLDEIKKHNIKYHIESYPSYNYSKYLKAYHLQPNFRSSLRSNHHPYYYNVLSELSGIQFDPTLNILNLSTGYSSFRHRGALRSKSLQVMDDMAFENENTLSEIAVVTDGVPAESGYFKESDNSTDLNKVTNPLKSIEKSLKKAQIRKNFQETIFFYPELTSNDEGIINIPFTMSDGIGQYKLMLYGYTKTLKQFYLEEDIISNKELMAEMHKPRFLYSGDKIIWTAKISNLSDKVQKATTQLKLTDAITSDLIFKSDETSSFITLQPGESQSIQWESSIPNNMVGEITYELKAETEKYIDIEIDQIPVLTTQKLIHENFALTIPANGSKTYNLSDLLNSTSFDQFRLECMSKPIWQVIKALPYAKSNDDKIISNLLDEYITIKIGQDILKKNPNISERLLALSKTNQKSELRNRQELKSITLTESPWLGEAKSQEEEMQQLAKFFNKNNLERRIKVIKRKITKHQSSAGGFSWIKGGKDSYYMSLYVAKSLSHLEKLKLGSNDLRTLKTNLLIYLDTEVLDQYNRLDKNGLNHMKVSHVTYLDVRSYFLNTYTVHKKARIAYDFFLQRSLDHWSDASFVNRIALAKIAHGNGKLKIADNIFNTLNEYRIDNTEQQTIHWKQLANGVSWLNRKLVNHADLIHLYTLQGGLNSDVYKLQNWLLQQKRSQYWGSSSETSQLIYALLLNTEDTHIFDPVPVNIKINGKAIDFTQSEGWLSKTWTDNKNLDLNKAKLEIVNASDRPIWISGYQQYFSPIAEVKTEKSSMCSIEKVFYKRTITNHVELWEKTDLKDLKIGDEVKVNMKLTLPQQLDFVYLQDYFGACFEPVDRISEFKYNHKGSYYLNIKDYKMQFYFNHIARGTHEFEFKTRIKQLGTYSNGYSEFQSYYAPEFGGHSASTYVKVQKD